MQVAVVEDNVDIAGLYEAILEAAHHTVRLIDPEKLEEIVGCDVVIIDMMMPGITGQDVLDFCAIHCPDIRKIVATALYEVPGVVRAVADAVLIKPFTPQKLREALKQ